MLMPLKGLYTFFGTHFFLWQSVLAYLWLSELWPLLRTNNEFRNYTFALYSGHFCIAYVKIFFSVKKGLQCIIHCNEPNPNNSNEQNSKGEIRMQSLNLLSSMLKNRVILTYRQGRSSLFVCHTKKQSIQKVILPKKAPFSRLRVTPKLKLLFIALASCLMPKKHSCRQMYAST